MKNHFLIIFLLLTFLVSGCETLKTYYLDKKEIPVEQANHAMTIRLKDIFVHEGTVKKR